MTIAIHCCVFPKAQILIVLFLLFSRLSAAGTATFEYSVREPKAAECQSLVETLTDGDLLKLKANVLAENIWELLEFYQAKLIAHDGAKSELPQGAFLKHFAKRFSRRLQPELARLEGLIRCQEASCSLSLARAVETLQAAHANEDDWFKLQPLLKSVREERGQCEAGDCSPAVTMDRIARSLVALGGRRELGEALATPVFEALNFLEYFNQTERNRYAIVVASPKIQVHSLFSIPYQRWYERFVEGQGKLDQTEKKLEQKELDATTSLLKDAIHVKALKEGKNTMTDQKGGKNRIADLKVLSQLSDFLKRPIETIELKTLDPGATNETVKNEVNESLKRNGQSPYILIDARKSGLSRDEAMRGIRRLGGVLKTRPLERLRELNILGADYHLTASFLSEAEYAKWFNEHQDTSAFEKEYWKQRNADAVERRREARERNRILFGF